MVEVSAEAVNFINDLLQKNDKAGYGIRIYLAGMGCSGPQFGMAFQEKVKEGDHEVGIERIEAKVRRGNAGPAMRKLQEKLEGVAIGGDRVRRSAT